ncbi:hypothetical protein JOD54_004159 [Actinokineospora baliensis]|uniref:RICIN domain-containing protein n=1 Tax=Actinokineospora baliensis TaxID=547056 RepID=UPI00195D1F11|nr:RICIN domain-containing protein [Actinokineospora baliensis]MBM7773955.1 hypothetical protein [Actinokineospora baliensis]
MIRRRLAGTLAAAATTLSLIAALPAQATPPLELGPFTIGSHQYGSNRIVCMAVTNDAGKHAVAQPCDNSTLSTWMFVEIGGGRRYLIRNVGTGRCLRPVVPLNPSTSPITLRQYTCDAGQSEQHWRVASRDEGRTTSISPAVKLPVVGQSYLSFAAPPADMTPYAVKVTALTSANAKSQAITIAAP